MKTLVVKTRAGHDLDVSTWYRVAVPAGVDEAIPAKASDAFAAANKSDEVSGPLMEQGVTMALSSPQEITAKFRSAIQVLQAARENAGMDWK